MAQDEALNKLKQTAYVSDQMFEEDKKFLADYFYINIDEFDKLVKLSSEGGEREADKISFFA